MSRYIAVLIPNRYFDELCLGACLSRVSPVKLIWMLLIGTGDGLITGIPAFIVAK